MVNLLASAEVWNWNYGPKGKTPHTYGGSAHSAAASFRHSRAVTVDEPVMGTCHLLPSTRNC
jgi:hypothetical protein